MAWILILLTVSSIKDQATLSLYSFLGLFPFVLSAIFLVMGEMLHWESYIVESTASLGIVTTILASITVTTRIVETLRRRKTDVEEQKKKQIGVSSCRRKADSVDESALPPRRMPRVSGSG